MSQTKRIIHALSAGFLVAFPLSIFLPSTISVVPGTITQKIIPLECAITTISNGTAQPTVTIDDACDPLQGAPVNGNPLNPNPNPNITIVEQGGRNTFQLPYIRSSGYAVVTNTDGVSTIKIPFEPITSSENTLNPREATQSIPGAVFVMGFSAVILVAVVVLL